MPDDNDDDARLLASARAGDTTALDALLERHQAQIFRFGMRMCRDPEDARDVLQETLLALARGVRDFRGESSISTWLYAVARSHCLKKRRRSKFAPDHEQSIEAARGEVESLLDPARTPEERVASGEVQAAVETAIGGLDPIYREVLVLRDVEGLSAPEVGKVLGIGVAAVKSRLHRARVALRAALAPRLGIPETGAPLNSTCPDVVTLLSRHLEGEIDAPTCAQVERHVEGCARCRDACESLRQTLALCRGTAPSIPVPPAVQAAVKSALRRQLAGGDRTPSHDD